VYTDPRVVATRACLREFPAPLAQPDRAQCEPPLPSCWAASICDGSKSIPQTSPGATCVARSGHNRANASAGILAGNS
jgi:hypothetical protein